MMRFYTYPPTRFEWPYLILSLNTYLKSKSWKNVENCVHMIVDSGVDKWFFIEKLKDYPEEYHRDAPAQFKEIQDKLGDKVTITIPDYPDDYTPGQTHENGQDNVDKTIASIRRYTGLYPEINWMPVAQAKYLDAENYISRLNEIGSYVDKYGRVGIGTVCKTHNLKFIEKCCKATRIEFPNALIHAFGATMECYPIIRNYVDSFDSTAYSWYTGRRKADKMMVRNQLEREMALTSWLLRADEILSIPSLDDTIYSSHIKEKAIDIQGEKVKEAEG